SNGAENEKESCDCGEGDELLHEREPPEIVAKIRRRWEGRAAGCSKPCGAEAGERGGGGNPPIGRGVRRGRGGRGRAERRESSLRERRAMVQRSPYASRPVQRN